MEPSTTVGCLWFVVIGFMFFAQHHVCDAYFVPAINVFVSSMRRSKSKFLQRWGEEAVAGATICALGCNGPELFTNLISLYTGSDAGIGVVVGSEIFNLLIIIGCATLAAPVVPLQIEKVPFARDVFFYALSIGLLYWALLDKAISFQESTTLLGAAVVYVATVYFTTDCANCLGVNKVNPVVAAVEGEQKRRGRMHGIEVEVEEVVHGRMADGRAAGHKEEWNLDAMAHGIAADSGAAAKTASKAGDRQSIGFQFASADALLGPIIKYEDLREVVLMEGGVIHLEFYHNIVEHITLKVKPVQGDYNQFLANIQEYSAANTKAGVWTHGYKAGIGGAVEHLVHAFKDRNAGIVYKLTAIPEFIVDVCLKGTLFAVDVKDATKESRWPLCFLGAMAWLAVFSFAMLEVANQIHYNIPVLPSSFLGITVCAIGTSFPNAVASIIMSQQNKPAAAIANALGSNVQNVFLAMALPWVIYGCQTDYQPINQNVAGISEGVLWMMGTLILVVFLVLMPGMCQLNKCNGIFLCCVYIVYLILTSGETFGWWPPLVK